MYRELINYVAVLVTIRFIFGKKINGANVNTRVSPRTPLSVIIIKSCAGLLSLLYSYSYIEVHKFTFLCW